ncbi:PEP-CTERM sorting domain-containing protein [Desulfobacter postgatei]|mgnify:CR=1 FL=1|uniref:PEP-CTERM sorting domain-containing protein n=1 Tax=Desulfobacter postgatei TaxID=2293 RepID=UPI00259BCD38|nr:PEP-CTERM sorting domain-containing protein [uncultured Desulfobacter sp.]
MKKFSFFLIVFILMLSVIESSYANSITYYYYTFTGEDDGVTGSANMLIEISGNTLKATLNNTSEVDQDGGLNEPGITGFGVDLTPNTLNLSSWSLEAIASDGMTVTTLGNDAGTSSYWVMTKEPEKFDGVMLDYLPNNESGLSEALFNPDAYGTSGLPGGSNTVFYTEAILSMTFGEDEDILGVIENSDTVKNYSPFVRMQRVGEDGSLKLAGTPTPYTPPPPPNTGVVPEPGTMILLGFGLISLAGIGRRKIKK